MRFLYRYVRDVKTNIILRRCLWLVEENEAHHLAELKENGLESDGGRHKIGCFLGSEAANYKTNLSLKLNHTEFYPSSYAMPKEAARFKQGKSFIRY